MWTRKDKDKIKFLKVTEIFKLDQKGENIFELYIPTDDNFDNKVLVRSHHKDRSGNIYEFDTLIDLKNDGVNGGVIKHDGKRVYYGPLSKRLKSKALVILISLIIGIGFTFLFDINIIFFVSGIVTIQILEEVYFQRINKKYENRINTGQDNIEIIKRI